jgi:hypothetical protein
MNSRQDDVDRLFGTLSHLPPPRDFAAGVMRAVADVRPMRLSGAWLAATVSAVVAVLALGFLTGQALAGGGLLVLIQTLFSDGELVALAPAETLLAALEVVPWIELAGAGLALLALRRLLQRLTPPRAPEGA